MTEVVILGAGNVAIHLFRAFSEAENTDVIQVYNHRGESLEYFKDFTDITTDINDLKKADFYILALKDDVIPEITEQLKNSKAIVLHTAGAVNIKTLEHLSDFGVLYPLQTFSISKPISFNEIPVCIEANSEKNLQKIKNLALEITKDVREINSEQRSALHLAAVFVNNFTNHLYSIGAEICQSHDVDFSILKPLIKETTSKIEGLTPRAAQTGPALRNDQKTIDSHLALLSNKHTDIYRLLTKSIQDFHGKKL